jgi:hypothetical protein
LGAEALLGYTTFQLTWESEQVHRLYTNREFDVAFRVKIKNTGKVGKSENVELHQLKFFAAGDEVAMAYLSFNSTDYPIKTLFGFKRVSLNPGNTLNEFSLKFKHKGI